jgi:transcriptional regulator with XRE-family HTH domain
MNDNSFILLFNVIPTILYENSFNNWDSMSDKALAEQIGAFIKHHRLEQDKTQDALAADAGISRSTLSLLERGETVNLSTLIQVLRVLDQLQVMNAFVVQETISPLELARLEKKKRKRATGKSSDTFTKTDW